VDGSQYKMRAILLADLSLMFLLAFGPYDRASAAQTIAQQSPCDPSLGEMSQNPMGYKLRGDRCEGIYIQPVSSSSLLVASFTRGFDDFDPSSLQALSIDWSSPAPTAVRLRAYALREKLYYRMDAAVGPDRTTYLWSGSVLNSLHLSKRDVGVVGFTDFRVGREQRTLYLPLRIHEKSQTSARGYQIIIVPGSELKEIFISLAKVDADGRPGAFIISDRPVHCGYCPAERGVPIDIPDPGAAGIYYLEIGATSKYGGPMTQQIWFYHGAS
jgi:hypothetical protein